MRALSILKLVTLMLVFTSVQPAFAITSIRIASVGEYLGQGQTFEINETNSTIEAVVVFDNVVRIRTSFENWEFNFAKVGDGLLLEGAYEEATRYPFNSSARPGLGASGDGRGCNQLTGRFVVLEAEYGPANEVLRFAADLELRCDGSTNPFRANVRINSNLPLILENPTASAGRDRIIYERDNVMLDATESVGGNGAISSYQWTQLAGPAVELSSATTPSPVFEAPDVAGPSVLLTFEVEVVNLNNLFDTEVVNFEVRDRSQPRSLLTYQSDSGDSIGRGNAAILTEDDGTFIGDVFSDGNLASIRFDGDNSWQLSLKAPDGQPLSGSTNYIATADIADATINISHDGRGCGTPVGEFLVYSISQGMNVLNSFSADFTQSCSSSSSLLTGELRYQVVLPEAHAGPSRTVAERTLVVLDSSASLDADGLIAQTEWLQLSGPTVALDTPDANATFNHELGDAQLEQAFEFQLRVTDELGQVDEDFVTITVIQNNQPPTAADDTIVLQQGFTIEVPILDNDTDVDGLVRNATLRIVDQPGVGFVFWGGESLSFSPPADFTGTATATYAVSDNDEAESNIATVNFEVTPGPVGSIDRAETDAGAPVTIDVLANDLPANAALIPASVAIVSTPGDGNVIVNADGSLQYTPSPGFFGTDTFTYDVADGDALRTPPTLVVVLVTSPPPAPAPAPAPSPAPVTPAPAASNAQQTCTDVNIWSGDSNNCGGGSVSPFGLLAIALLYRRRSRGRDGRVA